MRTHRAGGLPCLPQCGAERADRVVRPYTVCHCEPVLTLAWESVPSAALPR